MALILFGIQIRRKDRVDRFEVAIRRESRPVRPAKCLPDPEAADEIEAVPESRRLVAS